MSTRRHCDLCNTAIVSARCVTVKPSNVLTALSPEFVLTSRIDLCGDCWTAALEHLKTTRKENTR